PKGLIALGHLNHLTIFSSGAECSNTFYREVFGFSTRAYQGPTARALAVGPSVQFLMIRGGAAGRPGSQAAAPAASINHACWSLDGFKPDDILGELEMCGLRARGGPG